MEIFIQESSSKLTLKYKSSFLSRFYKIFVAIICMSFPLIAIYPIGVTTLKCKRLEATQVNCEKLQSKFFGFIQQPRIELSQVKAAKFKSEEVNNNGKRNIDNWVTLITDTGEITIAEDFTYINGVKGSASEMQGIATQINNFIQSNQPDLLIKRDLRWNFGQSLFWLGLTSIPFLIGMTLLLVSCYDENLTFDKNNCYFIRKQQILLYTKHQYYPLGEIKAIDLETTSDNEGNTFYQLTLLPKSIHKRILISSTNFQELKNIQTTISDFLQHS